MYTMNVFLLYYLNSKRKWYVIFSSPSCWRWELSHTTNVQFSCPMFPSFQFNFLTNAIHKLLKIAAYFTLNLKKKERSNSQYQHKRQTLSEIGNIFQFSSETYDFHRTHSHPLVLVVYWVIQICTRWWPEFKNKNSLPFCSCCSFIKVVISNLIFFKLHQFCVEFWILDMCPMELSEIFSSKLEHFF